MARLLTQIIYDLQKNKKIYILTEAVDVGQSYAFDSGTGGIDLSPINGEGGGMIKFYPSGSREIMTYTIEKLSDDVPSMPEDNLTYLWFAPGYPTSQVYSLLNNNISLKELELNEDMILLGTMPNIVGMMLSAASELTILQQFGVVAKDLYYDSKYEAVSNHLAKESNPAVRTCNTLNSISNNKSQTRTTFYSTGPALCSWAEYEGGPPDAHITGIQYISKGYDIDYYNQTIIPVTVSSTVDSVQTLPVQTPITESWGDGGYTKKSFTTNIYTFQSHTYKYFGEDPLEENLIVNTDMYSESLVDLENFLILAHVDKSSNFQKVIIANKGKGVHRCQYHEETYNTYDTTDVDGVTFYRPSTMTHARLEDCIIADVGGTTTIYPCTKGAAVWNGLTMLMSYMKIVDRDIIIEQSPLLDESQHSGYFTRVGSDMLSLENMIAAQEGSLHVLNSHIGVIVKQERIERSFTTCAPLGRNMSHRTLYSERVGEINQDYDTKAFTGGALPFKTETCPTYPARASAGNGEIAQNVGYGNAVYYDESDIQTMADNFNGMNENLSNITVTFKGPATIDDFEETMSQPFILDNVSWDIGRNMTSFSCRTVIFN